LRGNIAAGLARRQCQVAVSLSIANHHASLPVAYRLYLPQEWTNDSERLRRRVCLTTLASKPSNEDRARSVALGLRGRLPRGVVLMDAGTAITASCAPPLRR